MYPRFHLDKSSCVGRIVIGKAKIRFISCSSPATSSLSTETHSHLYLYDSQHIMHIYNMEMNYQNQSVKATVTKLKSISFAAHHVVHPSCMVTVCVGTTNVEVDYKSYVKSMHNNMVHSTVHIHNEKCIFLHGDRRLTAFDAKTNKEHLLDEEPVDQFWIETETNDRLIYFTSNQQIGVKVTI